MKKDDIKNSADLFFYKGNIDFNVAVFLMKGFAEGECEVDLDTIMFHFQQCVEKMLKSLLSKNKIRIQQTHSIESLLDLLSENHVEVPRHLDVLISLSEYAVEGRYGVIHDDIADAEHYIVLLQELLVFVKSAVGL